MRLSAASQCASTSVGTSTETIRRRRRTTGRSPSMRNPNLLLLGLSAIALALAAAGCSRAATQPSIAPPHPSASANGELGAGGAIISDDDLRKRKAMLSKEQFEVTQHEGTEPPFRN